MKTWPSSRYANGVIRVLAILAVTAPVSSAGISTNGVPDRAGEHNTGPDSKTVLQQEPGREITDAGVTIEGVEFTGLVSVVAPNVTLRNFRISADTWAALSIKADHVTIEHCEINGNNAPGIRGISIVARFAEIRNCNIHNVEDGIYIGESSNVLIENNYIHTLRSDWDGPHFDGIATDGGVSDIQIRYNNIENLNNQTSAIMISNYFGGARNIEVKSNRLAGGGYTVYVDAQFNESRLDSIRIQDNQMVRGFYGFSSIVNNRPDWRGNVDDVTGEKAE